MRILITGATGFLGNNLVRALVDDGHQVIAGIRNSSDRKALSGLDVEILSIDLCDRKDVGMAVSEIDVVVHAAAMIHVGKTRLEESRKVNVDSTRLIAEAARRKNVRMIYVSTVDALAAADRDTIIDETQTEPAKPSCAYVTSKREAEQVVLDEVENGLDGVIVNPGFMVGPWDWKPSSGKMMLMLYKQPILFFTPGGGCTVADVRDVAEGINSAIKHGRSGERYILGGQNMSYLELWQLMAKVMKKRPPVRPMRNFFAGRVGAFGDFVSRFLSSEAEINSVSMKLGQMYHWYSSEKAEKELGYQIGDVEDALRDALDWFKEFGYL